MAVTDLGARVAARLGRTRLDTVPTPPALARALDDAGGRAWHARRVPGLTGLLGRIDHLVVGPAGAFVVDEHGVPGRPHRVVAGGIVRPKAERLVVGSHTCTALVEAVRAHVDVVRAALDAAELAHVPVRGLLCLPAADWSAATAGLVVGQVEVVPPTVACGEVVAGGVLDEAGVAHAHALLGAVFGR